MFCPQDFGSITKYIAGCMVGTLKQSLLFPLLAWHTIIPQWVRCLSILGTWYVWIQVIQTAHCWPLWSCIFLILYSLWWSWIVTQEHSLLGLHILWRLMDITIIAIEYLCTCSLIYQMDFQKFDHFGRWQ